MIIPVYSAFFVHILHHILLRNKNLIFDLYIEAQIFLRKEIKDPLV